MNDIKRDFKFRPRFRMQVDHSPIELKEKIQNSLIEYKEKCTGKIVDNHVILKIPIHQQHFWSPQLTLELEDHDNGTLVRGLFGPKPAVWTMFVFFYSSIGFLTLMGLIFGLSQMMLNMDPWGLWSAVIGGFLLIFLFTISKVGQKLGKDQMDQLKKMLINSLEIKS